MHFLQKIALLVLSSLLLFDPGLAQALVECGRPTGGVASGSAPAAQKGDTHDPAIDGCRAALKASPNDPGSMFQLGRSLSAGSKHREAIRHFLDAADRGHAGAMTELGLVFEYGRGVPRNLATALAWYEKAAEGGDSQAMIELGRWSASGTGVDLDLATAKAWYEKAAALGNASAMDQLGVFYEEGRGVPQDFALAHEWYAKAAELNFPKAMAHLGQLHENGRGAQVNLALARRWYEKAVMLGDPDAMAYLGALFEHGHGVSPSLSAARDLYEKGAALGSAHAMANLATLFQVGRGVPQDIKQARLWYERAAALGLPRAINVLGQLYLTGDGPKNFGLAKEFFEKAAALGHGGAMNNIGLLYLNGRGVERDEVAAKFWFAKAVALGNKEAQSNLSRLEDAIRAGYASLGMQISARRSACTQSCWSLHRTYVTSICARYFPTALVEQGERRNCIDLSLRFSKQCMGSCREWAQGPEKPNACEACFQALILCSAKDRDTEIAQNQQGQYPEVSQGCLASLSHCSVACQPEARTD